MRIFVAVTFDDRMRENLIPIQNVLREQAGKGSFTLPENLHLTIKFIGETAPGKLEGIKECLRTLCASARPFYISLGSPGCFKRDNECLYWVGIKKGFNELKELARRTEEALFDSMGFKKEKRSYKAHVTIARRVRLEGNFSYDMKEAAAYEQPVNSLVLMESSRIDGKLTYTPLFMCKFGG